VGARIWGALVTETDRKWRKNPAYIAVEGNGGARGDFFWITYPVQNAAPPRGGPGAAALNAAGEAASMQKREEYVYICLAEYPKLLEIC